MTQFLLVFSLLLHGITFFILIYFYRHFKDLQNMDKMEKSIREVDDLFHSYLLELKDENEKLLNILRENGKNVNVHQTDNRSIHSNLLTDKNMEKLRTEIEKTNVKQAEMDTKTEERKEEVETMPEALYTPESISHRDVVEEPSLKSSVLSLYQQGKTVDDIAKQLNRGKTEIELIIKFHTKS